MVLLPHAQHTTFRAAHERPCDTLHVSLSASDQIESKMSEEERSNPIFFPEHLHVLREKLESNRKRSHGRSVGELPGRSRRATEKTKQTSATSGASKQRMPSPVKAYVRVSLLQLSA